MTNINNILLSIEEVLKNDDKLIFFTNVANKKNIDSNEDKANDNIFETLRAFILQIIHHVDEVADILKGNENILVSVKNQKTLRTCFQIVTSLGISNCLIPGVGLKLSTRCVSAQSLPHVELTDDQKYALLVECTEFLHRSYTIPVLKNIILTFHLTDYLAALIQLAYAPLKKPGVYKNFTMTEEKYLKLNTERKKFILMYDHLVNNCFQPILMKELLVLQNVKEVEPPAFLKRVIAKEMSRQLISPGGLLSLIRCFIESYDMDVGIDWNKIHMITKIISTKHGNITDSEYLNIICNQLKQIFNLNNKHYLTTAISCLLSLLNKYGDYGVVKHLAQETLQPFNYESLLAANNDIGTIILTAQEVEHKISVLHTCTFITKADIPKNILSSNMYTLLMMSMKSSNSETKKKLNDIIFKILELEDKDAVLSGINKLFSKHNEEKCVSVEEYSSGLLLKCNKYFSNYSAQDITSFLLFIFENSSNDIAEYIFEFLLQIFIDHNKVRQRKNNNEVLLADEDEPTLLDDDDQLYASIIILLSEISASTKAVNIIKSNPLLIINFVEKLLLSDIKENDECITIALVLMNSVLSYGNKTELFIQKIHNLVPMLNKLTESSEQNHMLCKELMSLLNCEYPQKTVSAYNIALANVFDGLLPVRAHGIMELTKLIDAADPETISKRHYVYCLLQEQLKDADSYVYLAAINAIASLASHCTEDVLNLLCKEFLQITSHSIDDSHEQLNKVAEMRMKIGDIVVKVVRRLGEMAIQHKTVLLNTFLCGCRDEDPLIRASSLSNLAEIALVLHYRVGTIIYEILVCIWSIIETDKAIECRRAAVMVVASLFKGLGKETLVELKENLLPMYRTLNQLYKNDKEDSIVRLHAQLALEQLNDIVKEFLFAKVPFERQFSINSETSEIKFK